MGDRVAARIPADKAPALEDRASGRPSVAARPAARRARSPLTSQSTTAHRASPSRTHRHQRDPGVATAN